MSVRRGQGASRCLVAVVLGICMLSLGGPSLAGVIEDAEEILREVQQDGPGRPVPGAPGRARQIPLGSDSWSHTVGPGVGTEDGLRASESRASKNSWNPSRRQPTLESQAEGPRLAVSSREVTQRKLSLFLLIILALLVVLASLLGRRLETSD